MKYRLVATLMTMAFVTPAIAEDAVCYNCPPQWADWASMLEAIDKEIDVQKVKPSIRQRFFDRLYFSLT